MAGAPVGNQNAAKAKRWQDALHKALVRYADDKVPAGQALDKIAEQVVIKALSGDKDCIAEIGNRLDGKPAQAIVGDDDAPPIRAVTRIELVDLDGGSTSRTPPEA